MDAEEMMADYAQECGWSAKIQLALALQYIENQKDNEAFEEFLIKQQDLADDDSYPEDG